MFDLCSPPEDDEGEAAVVSRLRAILVSSAKETAFKKVRTNFSLSCHRVISFQTHNLVMHSYICVPLITHYRSDVVCGSHVLLHIVKECRKATMI